MNDKPAPEFEMEPFEARNLDYEVARAQYPYSTHGISPTRTACRVVHAATGYVVDDNHGYGYDQEHTDDVAEKRGRWWKSMIGWRRAEDGAVDDDDPLARRLYFGPYSASHGIDGVDGYALDKNDAFAMGAMLSELLMFEETDGRIDDDAILYRERSTRTGKLAYVRFHDVKRAIIAMKREMGLGGQAADPHGGAPAAEEPRTPIPVESVETDIRNGTIPVLSVRPSDDLPGLLDELDIRLGTRVFLLPCGGLADPIELTGTRYPSDPRLSYRLHPVLAEAAGYAESHPAETPVLVMDGLHRSERTVAGACLRIALRHGTGHGTLPANLRFVLSGDGNVGIPGLDGADPGRIHIYR